MPKWLEDAVFYEIYPQTFYDTNDDGIGDIEGIIEKLDYIKDLGANALWINPCFDSPFKDAGYDVRDYKKVAPRYGTNEDLVRLFEEAHKKGIHVLLDLVPGHTSEEHVWFKESAKAEKNEYSGRYIWTDFWIKGIPGHPYIAGETPRNGAYMLNFFKSQPALNYGWLHPTESWQSAIDSPEALATREAVKDIMRFWLDKGADGFRVDMADSLVKDDDENKSGTQQVWRDIRAMLDQEYPEAAMVSEWGKPTQAIPGGFHMDFWLDWAGNGYNSLFRDYERLENGAMQIPVAEDGSGKAVKFSIPGDTSYFRKDSGGDITRFLAEYEPNLKAIGGKGYISLITCNHDTIRAAATLGTQELKVAFATLFTLAGVPFIYYGDEIGMRYLDVPTKEGGYTRTGSRTPMQWNGGKNAGFSAADPEKLYLPVDQNAGAPDAESEMADPDSLRSWVKKVLALRHSDADFRAGAPYETLAAEKGSPLFIFRRGKYVVAVNPSEQEVSADGILPDAAEAVLETGSHKIADGTLTLGAQTFAVFKA